jgi:hypothetical protein
MKVDVIYENPILKFNIEIEHTDKINPSPKFSISQRNFSFTLPEDLVFEKIHPDHLALVSLIVCQPFIGEQIICPMAVSKQFAEAFNNVRKYKIMNIDENLNPWTPSINSRPGLAFSGGADSTAALSLLPPDTVPIFLDRTERNVRTLYDREAPRLACKKLIEIGYQVKMIDSDLEYVRDPIGFPVDVANAAPLILLAEHMELDSISFGTIMESSFGIGHKKYRDYPNGSHYKLWGKLFEAAGLPFLQVVSGVSEVGTSIINSKSLIGEYSHSCMRGKWKNPCKNCWKCFRKLLLDSVIFNTELSNEDLDNLFEIPEAKRYLSSFPIKHENVLIYITSKYNGNHVLMNMLKKRVRGDIVETSWMEKFYPKMFEVIPEKHQKFVEEKLNKYLEPMSKEEQEMVSNWDMEPMLEDVIFQEMHESFSFTIA